MTNWKVRTTTIAMVIVSLGSALAQVRTATPAHLKAITAQLYYSEKGTFSQNIIDEPNFALWNTIIGEGSAGSPSTATLITFEVAGKSDPRFLGADSLKITIKVKGKPTVSHRIDHLGFSPDGKHFESILLQDTGCALVEISAQVNQDNPMTKKISFLCGE